MLLPLGLIGTTDKFVVRYGQTSAGIPVEGALSILLDTHGRLLEVVSTAAPSSELGETEARVDAAAAARGALAEFAVRVGSRGVLTSEPKLRFCRDEAAPERGHSLVWIVHVGSEPSVGGAGPVLRELHFSARNGALERCFDPVMHFDVEGRVGAWITPGILPDDGAHNAIAQTTCSPCAVATCGACPPTACAVPASAPDPNPEIPIALPDLEIVDEFGNVAHSDADGTFHLPGHSPRTVTARFRGRFVTVANSAGADYSLTTTLVHDAGNRVLLGGPAPYVGDQTLTAQANAYWWVTRLRTWLREINPVDLTWEQDAYDKLARVNVAQTVNGCDAQFISPGIAGAGTPPETWFSIGGGICGFYPPAAASCGCCGESNGLCTNKANATVVVHEFGHWLNWLYFDLPTSSAFHEGMADAWAMYVTGQPQLFPYFCTMATCTRSGENCRQYVSYLDQFVGDFHRKGEVLMGSLWQVRSRLVAAHGRAGESVANALFAAWISAYPEFAIHTGIKRRWVLLDDDDANPMTPSPHQAAILSGFESHGL
ncbi:MAG: hypothetical protein HZA53_03840 [Planctomycetes bacterium]|nr:hypothetical protein [Planctomycetota bacterium]